MIVEEQWNQQQRVHIEDFYPLLLKVLFYSSDPYSHDDLILDGAVDVSVSMRDVIWCQSIVVVDRGRQSRIQGVPARRFEFTCAAPCTTKLGVWAHG